MFPQVGINLTAGVGFKLQIHEATSATYFYIVNQYEHEKTVLRNRFTLCHQKDII